MRKAEHLVGELEGFLDEGTTFSGDVTFHDTLRIDGKFKGSVKAGKKLVIGENADVDAEVEVAVVTVSGRVRGHLRASDRVELLPSARAECSIDCKVFVVHEGAAFDGRCTMSGRALPREVAPRDKVAPFVSSE